MVGGNRKNELVGEAIGSLGVNSYEGTVRLIQQLCQDGFKLAVVSSSATDEIEPLLIAGGLLVISPVNSLDLVGVALACAALVIQLARRKVPATA